VDKVLLFTDLANLTSNFLDQRLDTTVPSASQGRIMPVTSVRPPGDRKVGVN
jgi:hypothetical protein